MSRYERKRKQVCDGHSYDRQEQQDIGVAQLIESGARDHALDSRKAFIRTDAASGGGRAKPQTSARALDPRRERAIIDDFLPNGLKSAGFFQRSGTNENASASCSGVRVA